MYAEVGRVHVGRGRWDCQAATFCLRLPARSRMLNAV